MAETFNTPVCHCPFCGEEVDRATNATGTESPDEGDATICLKCGRISVFDDCLQLRKPTAAESSILNSDPRVALAQGVCAMWRAEHGQKK